MGSRARQKPLNYRTRSLQRRASSLAPRPLIGIGNPLLHGPDGSITAASTSINAAETAPYSLTTTTEPQHGTLHTLFRMGDNMLNQVGVIALCISVTQPAAADLRNAEVLIEAKNWKVLRTQDSCVAIWRDDHRIQLSLDKFHIDYKGRGGIIGYSLRFDDELVGQAMRRTTLAESNAAALILKANDLWRLLKANRLRTMTITALRSPVQEDIDLAGILEAHAVLASANCKG